MHAKFHKLDLPPLPVKSEPEVAAPAPEPEPVPVAAPAAKPGSKPAPAKPAAAPAAAATPAAPPAAPPPVPEPAVEDPRAIRLVAVCVEAEPTATVAALKRLVKAASKVRRDRLVLLADGRRADDAVTLESAGYTPQAMVHCRVLPPTGSESPESDDETADAAAAGKPGAKPGAAPPKRK
jgi:hypothetical protein